MHLSPEAEEILKQMQSLREARGEKLHRDLYYIDAEYDRRIRRVRASTIWNRSSCTCFSSKPFCFHRFCSRRLRWIRRRIGKS